MSTRHGTVLDVSPLTAKDRADPVFSLELGVDRIAPSLVQRPSDLTRPMS